MRRFKCSIECNGEEVSECVIDIEQKLIDIALSEDWKSVFYDLENAEGVAAHVAWILCHQKERLSNYDGFVGVDNSLAKIIEYPNIDFEYIGEEIKQ